MIRLLLTLALMCENVNAAPQVSVPARIGDRFADADSRLGTVESAASVKNPTTSPVGAAPFVLLHPLCQTGFTIAMRFDERNAAGTITKSVWVRKCTKGRIVYGRKV